MGIRRIRQYLIERMNSKLMFLLGSFCLEGPCARKEDLPVHAPSYPSWFTRTFGDNIAMSTSTVTCVSVVFFKY